jgi:hypothetical protein
MEKHIEILKNWLENATQIWLKKYEWTFTDRQISGIAKNTALHSEAVTVHGYISRYIKYYTRLVDGYNFSERQLKKLTKRIENLPNLETTHPNLLV